MSDRREQMAGLSDSLIERRTRANRHVHGAMAGEDAVRVSERIRTKERPAARRCVMIKDFDSAERMGIFE